MRRHFLTEPSTDLGQIETSPGQAAIVSPNSQRQAERQPASWHPVPVHAQAARPSAAGGRVGVTLLPVCGMFCPDCVSRLCASLHKVPGVRRVVIDLGARSLSPVLVVLGDQGSRQSVIEAVHAVGFTIATTNLENESQP